MDGDGGARGRENSDSLYWYTRHWETHSRHINAFTHWHERAHKRVLLPTATQTRAGIPEGSTSLLSLPLNLTTLKTFTKAEPLQRSESIGLTSITGWWHFGSSSASRSKVPNPTQEGGGLADEWLWKELNYLVIHQVHLSVNALLLLELTLDFVFAIIADVEVYRRFLSLPSIGRF